MKIAYSAAQRQISVLELFLESILKTYNSKYDKNNTNHIPYNSENFNMENEDFY